MDVAQYLAQGKALKEQGFLTDGCSFIGFLLADKYEPACWSHDFARKNYIVFDDEQGQANNDYYFRLALRSLGMSKWKSNVIYYATRTQGYFLDNYGITSRVFVKIVSIVVLLIAAFLIY